MEDAQNIARYPMNFRACAECGHIFNIEFDYSEIPYVENSNLMFNKGAGWQIYLDELIDNLDEHHSLEGKILLEIGCGEGHFLRRIKNKFPSATCIGFEPGIESKNAPQGIEVYQDYFLPERDLPKHRPDFLICRHVLEHLEQPKEFVSEISYWCNMHDVYPVFLAEVPCIDKAIKHTRINDYLYEHVSNFTEYSFGNMFKISGYQLLNIASGYDGEVVFVEAKPKKQPRLGRIKKSSAKYFHDALQQQGFINKTLAEFTKRGEKVAFWGGTGKGASFLNAFQIDAKDFPIVIDSDRLKVGKFVPGTGQQIKAPEFLLENNFDIIIICTQWRARDIFTEICAKNIPYKKVLVLINKKLREYKGENI